MLSFLNDSLDMDNHLHLWYSFTYIKIPPFHIKFYYPFSNPLIYNNKVLKQFYCNLLPNTLEKIYEPFMPSHFE